jgi:hypothetical protein
VKENMNEKNWLEELKKDKEENKTHTMFQSLQIGKNVFVIDLATKEKVVKTVNNGNEDIQKTYIMFKLVNGEKEKISFTSYQYYSLLKEAGDLDKLTQVIEVIADVKFNNKKRIYTFNVRNMEEGISL